MDAETTDELRALAETMWTAARADQPALASQYASRVIELAGDRGPSRWQFRERGCLVEVICDRGAATSAEIFHNAGLPPRDVRILTWAWQCSAPLICRCPHALGEHPWLAAQVRVE